VAGSIRKSEKSGFKHMHLKNFLTCSKNFINKMPNDMEICINLM